jgi:tyrosinase
VSAAVATASKPPIRHRKNVYHLTPAQLASLREAFDAVYGISDNRGYQYWAGTHGVPGGYCVHNPPPTVISTFLPWHRAYLYFFELALRDQVPDAMLTWWNWASPRAHQHGIPGAFAAAQAGGQPNPLHQAAIDPSLGGPTETHREPDAPANLPTAKRIQNILKIQQFNRFSARLEDVHGEVHGWVGGEMSRIDWAAYDPIFWAHHANIDRLWARWQLAHSPAFPRSYLDRALPPFPMTVRQTLDVHQLGYDYASSTSHVKVA